MTVKLAREGRLGLLTIDRPQALNALNNQVLDDLSKVFTDLKTNPVGALIVTGAGEKSFVAGADIKEMESMTSAEAKLFGIRGQTLFCHLEEFPFPTIAAVNGFALGGGLELALACDWIIASSNTKWGLPEVSLGLIPGYGGTQRLSRVLGKALAKRIALTGEVFSAAQGLDWGLFAHVEEPNQLLLKARAQAEMILTRAPLALGFTKRSIELGFDETLTDGLELEAQLFAQAFETDDHHEGIQAFVQKRKANFKGE